MAEGVDVKMCENIFYFLKLHGFCFIVIVSLIIFLFCKRKKGDSEEKCKCKPIIDFIIAYFIYIFTLILSLFILYRFLILNSNIWKIIPDENMGEALGLIISALLTVTGVFVGFYFNKKQTYKEIVTRERIEWLHKLQNNLAEYLKLTRQGRVEVDNQDSVSQLFYKIIFAINHDKDREALNAIRKYNDYLKFQGICYDEYQNDINKNIYSVYVDKDPSSPDDENKYDVEIMKLQHFDLLREDVESKFVEIFKSVWEDVKGEAD